MRGSRCGNVIVCGFAIKEQVAHTAADEIGGVSVLAQCARNADGFLRFFWGKIHFLFHRKGRKGRKGKVKTLPLMNTDDTD
jgi:hypothetical protein